MPQVVVNEKGERAYWDGKTLTPLKEGSINDAKGASKIVFDNISPEDRARVEAELKAKNIEAPIAPPAPQQAGIMGPAERSGALQQTREAAMSVKDDPKLLAETQERGKEFLSKDLPEKVAPAIFKEAVASVIPALMSGGGSLLTTVLRKNAPGQVSRILRMAGGGGGAAAGEEINQAVGLSEGGAGTTALSGALGALPGMRTPMSSPRDPRLAKLQRLAAGKEVSEVSSERTAVGKAKYDLARQGAAVNTETLLAPLDDMIMREMNTPNFNEDIVTRMMNLRDSLTERVLQIERTRRVTPSASREIAENPPINTIDGIMHRLGLRSRQGPVETSQITDVRVAENPINANPENLVDDLKQLRDMSADAKRLGRTDLAKQLTQTYRDMAQRVPGLTEGDKAYGQGKALSRGAKAVRSGGAVSVDNLLDDPKLGGGFTPKQKSFLSKKAAESDDISQMELRLLNHPLGRALLRRGVGPQGTLEPAAFAAAMQFAQRLAPFAGPPIMEAISGKTKSSDEY